MRIQGSVIVDCILSYEIHQLYRVAWKDSGNDNYISTTAEGEL